MANKSEYDLRLIFWELTTACNLRCVHCRAEAGFQRDPDELSTEKIKAVIDEIVSFANPILVLTGGEPLYRPDIFEITSYAKNSGLTIALATNGTMIDTETARKIKECGIHRVSISLDGAKPETHDSFRGILGSFDTALRGFHLLKKEGLSLQINTTIAKHNLDELAELVLLAEKLGADALHIFLLIPVGCGATIADEMMISPQQYEEVLTWFYKKSLETSLQMRATCAPHYYRIARQISPQKIERASSHSRFATFSRGCLAGIGVLFISSKGIVQPCGYFPTIAGDLKISHLKKIWYESPLFKSLRNYKLLKGRCGYCEFVKVCGGCRARAMAIKGDYLEEEPYCLYQPLQQREKGDQ